MEFASSSSNLQRKYDVLIHFNGEDIRRKFVSHLDSALSAVGFTTFLHQENAVKEMQIQEPILDLCRVVIVVFTKSYSESAWCLHQLQQIIKWHETYSRHVLPMYYEIQPSDVRLQKGNFGTAFKATAHQTFSDKQLEHGMCMWSHALTKTANFFGWDESNYRSDAELVDKIVKSILHLPVLSATKFPVGLQSYVEDVIQIIKDKSAEVCRIGICGVGGSGKTTLATAIYNQIHSTFTHQSFIEDISEVSVTKRDYYIQKQLFSDVLKTNLKIHCIEMGRRMIQERLYGEKMLIVLDNVKDDISLYISECSALLGEGSVIIMTTRNEDLLKKLQVDSIFRINLGNPKKSIELLSWHAFREAKPKEEYYSLAKRLVAYCGGLPLALEVVGTYLYERTEEEWNTVLLKLDNVPQHEVLQILKISFDGLPNQMERDLFLDICCFFVGKGRAYVRKILNGCGVDADSGIRVLLERNLIKVKKNNKFGVHPLLRDMGREIISDISRNKTRNKNRLWLEKDIHHELLENTLFSSQQTKVIHRLRSTGDFFERHPLKVRDPSRLLELLGASEYHPKKLTWMSWQGFPSEYLPNDFYLHDAVAIDLKYNLLRFLWKQPQVLVSLKILNLSHSMYLTETPDFSRLPSLEQLILRDCPRLREVHQSVGCLCNLTLLNLKDCTSLTNLPRETYKLKSLKALILSGCSKLGLMEKDIGQMESLITLIAENTVVKQVPFSIVCSKSIGYISLHRFEGLSHYLFPSIIRCWMSPTMNPLSYIHSFCMDKEHSSGDDIMPLFNTLPNLRSVVVQCDSGFPLSKQVKSTLVEYVVNISESGISKHHFRLSLIGFGRHGEFLNTMSESISKVLAKNESSFDVSLPGDNDPYWLTHMGEGHSVSFTLPQDRVMKGMTLCVVYLSTSKIIEPELTAVFIANYTKCTLQMHNHGSIMSFNDEDWDCIMSNLGSGDKVEIFVTFGHGLMIKSTSVYLIYGELNDLEMEHCPEPKENALNKFIKKMLMSHFW